MHPILFRIGPITIYSYGFMLALAFLVSTFLLSRGAIYGARSCIRERGCDKSHPYIGNLCLIVLLAGIIGGRILYIILNLRFFQENPQEVFQLWHGGLVWYGGLGGALLAGIIYLKAKKQPIVNTLDFLVPYVALAQAIGRVGCFLNGCCFGALGALPVQLISTLSLLVIFLLLRRIQEAKPKPGAVFSAYLLLYSAKRFAIEFLREDSVRSYFGLTIFQVISAIIFLCAVGAASYAALRQQRGGRIKNPPLH